MLSEDLKWRKQSSKIVTKANNSEDDEACRPFQKHQETVLPLCESLVRAQLERCQL